MTIGTRVRRLGSALALAITPLCIGSCSSSDEVDSTNPFPALWFCGPGASGCICQAVDTEEDARHLCEPANAQNRCCYVQTNSGVTSCRCEPEELYNPGTCATRPGRVDSCPPTREVKPVLAWRCTDSGGADCTCLPSEGEASGSCSQACCILRRSDDDDFHCVCSNLAPDACAVVYPLRDELVPSCPPAGRPVPQQRVAPEWDCQHGPDACMCIEVGSVSTGPTIACPTGLCCRLFEAVGGLSERRCLCTLSEQCEAEPSSTIVPECPPQ
jgi:hypothetical protein